MELKRALNLFTWVPSHLRVSFPPRKPDESVPVYWLARSQDELYFVNNSTETIEALDFGQGGFVTQDEAVTTISSIKTKCYFNIQPNEAVKLAEYDSYYDLDYVIGVRLYLKKGDNITCINVLGEKNGPKGGVLLWQNGKAGKWVSIFPVIKYERALVDKMRQFWLDWDPLNVLDYDDDIWNSEYDSRLAMSIYLALSQHEKGFSFDLKCFLKDVGKTKRLAEIPQKTAEALALFKEGVYGFNG